MKFSIITPSYNQGRFIDKCFQSVLDQRGDYRIEHIVLDNCSDDGTVERLEEYQRKESHVDRKIFIERDKGQSAAINRGFRLASGEIVSWLNTDEWYHKRALEKVSNFFRDNPEVDVVFGDCNFVDQEGRIIKRKREFGFSYSMLLFYGCYIPSCATFIRRRVFQSEIWLDEALRTVMDLDWYISLSRAGYRFEHLPECLASFCVHDENASHQIYLKNTERRQVQMRHSRHRWWRWAAPLIYPSVGVFFKLKRGWHRIELNRKKK